MAGHLAGTVQLPNAATGSGQTGQAQQMMDQNFPLRAGESVLFQSGTLQVSAPTYQAAIRDVQARIQATGRVVQVHTLCVPAEARDRGIVQPDAQRMAHVVRCSTLHYYITGGTGSRAGASAAASAELPSRLIRSDRWSSRA